jgi:hypothetical protein
MKIMEILGGFKPQVSGKLLGRKMQRKKDEESGGDPKGRPTSFHSL